ncbi:MAG TPA: hypothetical protein VFD41_06760 [Actinomycetales bacterium]|nr:hypothetical protein [Actinomycetales bacterium]
MTGGVRDEGASSVEYGLIAVAIAAVIAIVVFALGATTQALYVDSCAAIDAEITGGVNCP